MRVSRVYTSAELMAGKHLELDEDNAHYVRSVLRLKHGDELILFNGQGGEYGCKLVEVSRKAVVVAIGAWVSRSVESRLKVILGLGVSRGDRMDLSVQKAVELGVYEITPVMTERCVVQFKGDKKLQRLLHWQKIAQHAAEQSGRTYVPELSEVMMLQAWLDQQQGLRVFMDPYAETTLDKLKPESMQVTVLTGPEGGFSEQERDLIKGAGFMPVRLGQRILRTETASFAALSAVQMLWGDFAQ